MRTLLILSCLLSTPLGAPTAAQAPAAQPPSAKPPAAQPAPAKPPAGTPEAPKPVHRRPVAATPVTVTFTVADSAGAPIGGARLSAVIDGTERQTETTAGGIARFLAVKPGEYTVRADHDAFVSLERDIAVKSAPLDVTLVLKAAPAPAPAKSPEPAPVANTAPPGDARALSIVDFLESNHLNGRDPVRADQLGCTASAKTTLLQIRDDLPEKSQQDADEVLYVVAGEGTLRLGNKDVGLEAGGLAVVPRGTARGLTRKGKNALVVLSVVSGSACTK